MDVRSGGRGFTLLRTLPRSFEGSKSDASSRPPMSLLYKRPRTRGKRDDGKGRRWQICITPSKRSWPLPGGSALRTPTREPGRLADIAEHVSQRRGPTCERYRGETLNLVRRRARAYALGC